MEKMSEDYRKFSWDDVSYITFGVIMVLRISMRRMEALPAWLYFAIFALALVVGICEFIYYKHKRRAGKKGAWTFAYGVVLVLCGIGYLLEGLSMIL